MDLDNMLVKAFALSNKWKFFVQVDSEEIKEMTYMELGLFITSNPDNIERIHIITRES